MKYKAPLLLSFLAILFLVLLTACAGEPGIQGPVGPAGPAGPQGPAGPPGDDATVRLDYVGSEKCGACHEDAYATFMLSGHPYKLSKVVNGEAPVFPYDAVTGGIPGTPEGYTWDDISYVIGGFGWKVRFIDKEGYIITGDEDATTQWNYANEFADLDAGWVPYHAGEKKPYNCGSCHTTGYSPEGHQDDLEGIIGTWEFPGIQCEECHGPGSLHSEDPYGHLMVLDRSNQLCGECHYRGEKALIDASNGFTKHHEQYEELFNSKHFALQCITCHDPHSSAVYSDQELNPNAGIRQTCETCHFEQEEYAKVAKHFYMECTDCHMPKNGKSAQGNLDIFRGDISSHLFAINPDPAAAQYTEDGAYSMPYLTVDYACKQCHNGEIATEKTQEQLGDAAWGYHDRPIPTPDPTVEPTAESEAPETP